MDDKGFRKLFSGSVLVVVGAYALVNTTMNVLLNDIINEYGLTGASQGLTSSMLALGSMFAFLTTSVLSGRVAKWKMLILSTALIVIFMALTGFSSTFGLLLFACTALGVGCGWTDSFANSAIVDVNPGDSARYMGALHGWFGVGGLLCPLLITLMRRRFEWRGVYYILAVAVGALMLQYWIISARNRTRLSDMHGMAESRLTAAEIKQYLSNKHNLLLLLAACMYSFTQAGLLMWVVRYMTVQYNAAALGATAVSVFWVFATLSRFFAVRLRVKPMKLFIGGVIAAAVIQAVGVCSNSAVGMCIACGAIGLTSGHCMPVILNEGAARYQNRTSLPTSMLLLFMCVCRVIVPIVMGAVSDGVSMTAAMLIPVAAGILSGAAAIAAEKTENKTGGQHEDIVG